MNSWKSKAFRACAPPLTTLKCGTGSRGVTPFGLRYRCRGIPAAAANARATAIDVPTVAFAPSRLFVAVPSRPRMTWSTSWSESQPRPTKASAISPFTL